MITKTIERRGLVDTGISYKAAASPDWHLRAACAGTPDDIFYPARYEEEDANWALAICGICPVRQKCLDEAIKVEEDAVTRRYGIFGGMTPNERYQEWIRRGGTPAGKHARRVQPAA